MQNCPQCGHEIPEKENKCGTCGAEVHHLPVPQEAQRVYSDTKVESVDAEIIDENEERTNQQSFHRQQHNYAGHEAFGRVHGRGWQSNGAFGHASRELSCLPGFVTLVLGISLGIQLGFLASLGFFFFYMVGSALSMGISVRRTLMGKPVYVWLNRALVWALSYGIAFQLAI